MIKFDFKSIRLRMLSNLKKRASWARVLPNSVNIRLIETFAEEEAELARYDEYLTKETKWNLAKNVSSLFHQSTLLGYRPHRKMGASGFIEVSSKEEAFSDHWLAYVQYQEDMLVRHANKIWKATVSNIDSEPTGINSDWDRIRTIHHVNIGIPKYTQFQNDDGLSYVSTENVTLDASHDFVKVKIVQGEQKTNSFIAKGAIFEELVIINPSIDNYHYEVFVNGIKWKEINSLREALGEDKVFQTSDSPTFDRVYFRFGDDITGQKLEVGDTISIVWVETDGILGNLTTQGSITEATSSIQDIDNESVTLHCFNYDAIVGGKETEGLESIRRNGTFSFQAGDRLVSTPDYKVFLESNFDFIDKCIVWGAYEINFDDNNDPWEWIETNENMVFIAGITPGHNPLDITLNPDGTSNDSNKAMIIRSVQPRKSPSDIISFKQVEFIHVVVSSHLWIENENYLLPEMQQKIRELLIDRYGIESLQFKQPIYESNYQRLIDEHEGVRYHNTEFSFYKRTTFGSSYDKSGTLPLYDIEPNSVECIAETLDGQSVFLFAADDGEGNIVAESNYTVTGGAINYSQGSFSFTVESGLALDPAEYVLKIYYNAVSKDILPKKRNQILHLDRDEISITSEYYRGD